MGLDVYLYHNPDFINSRAKENLVEEFYNKIWQEAGPYHTISQRQKEEIKGRTTKFAEEHECTEEYGGHKYTTQIRKKSELYPEHLFQVGYFRSSYNSGGFNNIMSTYGLATLYDLFPHSDREGYFVPDWKSSLDMARVALVKLENTMGSTAGENSVMFVGMNMFLSPDSYPKDKATAMSVFLENMGKDTFGGDYSNAAGQFIKDGINVVAVLPGFDGWGSPGVYLFSKNKKEEGAPLQFYYEALRIVVETIEYVLSKPDPHNYYFSWSA